MTYSAAIAEKICSQLAEGKSLRSICDAEGMPDKSTVIRWLDQPEFATKYAHARAAQAQTIHDDMVQIEEEVLQGVIDPKAARVVLESQRWRADKLDPKRFGSKLAIGGADDLPPIRTMTDEQLAARVKALQDKVGSK